MSVECTYYQRKECTSCGLLALNPKKRTAFKQTAFEATVRDQLGGNVLIAPFWEPEKKFGSRVKAKLRVSGTLKNPILGLIDRSREATELLDCPLHQAPINEVLHAVKPLITEYKLAPYHVGRQQGELKGVILKTNHSGSEVFIRFVLSSAEPASKVKRLARELQKKFPYIKTISANIQPIPAAILEGEEEIVLTENEILWDDFGNFKLAFHPQTFSQVTHETAVRLYQKASELLAEHSIRSMVDLFCGVGGFSISAATAAAKLEWGHGVELSAKAIECARLGAAKNRVKNLKFECADVEIFLKNYSGPNPEALLFNPPRRGLSSSMIEQAKRLNPKLILYSSCNPDTLNRDIKLFEPNYIATELYPFDMFPLTEHLEVLAVLRRSPLER